jgi:C1A family cysteine protease
MEASSGNLQNSIVNPLVLSTRDIVSPKKNVAAEEFELKKLLKSKPNQSTSESKKNLSSPSGQNTALNTPVGRTAITFDKPSTTSQPKPSSNPATQSQQALSSLNPAQDRPGDNEKQQQYRLPKYFLITAFAEEETTYPDILSVHPSAVKSLV